MKIFSRIFIAIYLGHIKWHWLNRRMTFMISNGLISDFWARFQHMRMWPKLIAFCYPITQCWLDVSSDLIWENDMLLAVDIEGKYMLQIIMHLAYKIRTELIRFVRTQVTGNSSYDMCNFLKCPVECLKTSL